MTETKELKRIKQRERAVKALDLKLAGKKLREIGEELGGVSVTRASQLIWWGYRFKKLRPRNTAITQI